MKQAFLVSSLAFLALGACSQQDDAPAKPMKAVSERWVANSNVKTPPAGVAPATSDNMLDCNTPVTRTSTFKSLSAAFKQNAQLGMIPGAEGQEAKGLVLYAMVPSRKLYVQFWDDAMEHVSYVEPADRAVAWTGPQGIHVGSTLDYIQGINGKPFTISGFGWDYGGYAVDFKGGRLAKPAGGCTLGLRFDMADSSVAIPDGISGDGVQVSSDDPRLKGIKVVVSEMSVGWPLPAGVKPSE